MRIEARSAPDRQFSAAGVPAQSDHASHTEPQEIDLLFSAATRLPQRFLKGELQDWGNMTRGTARLFRRYQSASSGDSGLSRAHFVTRESWPPLNSYRVCWLGARQLSAPGPRPPRKWQAYPTPVTSFIGRVGPNPCSRGQAHTRPRRTLSPAPLVYLGRVSGGGARRCRLSWFKGRGRAFEWPAVTGRETNAACESGSDA